jgi:hypothetical protein
VLLVGCSGLQAGGGVRLGARREGVQSVGGGVRRVGSVMDGWGAWKRVGWIRDVAGIPEGCAALDWFVGDEPGSLTSRGSVFQEWA